jgi:DNA modification methylase
MMLKSHRILCGDAETALATLKDGEVDLTVTSPPYFRHRDYGVKGQIGREKTLDDYLGKIRGVLAQVLRVTAETGACFFVVGDTYEKQKLLLVPHRIAISADELGWTVRNDLIWNKTDPPPESPRNRWRSGHEHILFLTRQSGGYKFSADAVRVPYAEATLRRWGNGQAYGGEKSENRTNAKDSRNLTFRIRSRPHPLPGLMNCREFR